MLVAVAEVDRKIERAKQALRAELIQTLDRAALERAIRDAEDATAKAEAAAAANLESRAVSLRRYHRLLAFHVATLLAWVAMAAAIGAMTAFAMENRARLDSIDRVLELPRR